jgi:fucose permease
MNNRIFLYTLRFFSKGWDVSFLVLLPFIQKIFHLTLIDIGFLSMAYVIASIVFSFFAGAINERIGNGKVIVVVVILYMVAWAGFLVRVSIPCQVLLVIKHGSSATMTTALLNLPPSTPNLRASLILLST